MGKPASVSSSPSSSSSSYRTAEYLQSSTSSYASVQYNSVPNDNNNESTKPQMRSVKRGLFQSSPTSSPVIISDTPQTPPTVLSVPHLNLTSISEHEEHSTSPSPSPPLLTPQEVFSPYNVLQEMRKDNFEWQTRVSEDISQLRALLNTLYVENNNLRAFICNNGMSFTSNDPSLKIHQGERKQV